MNNKSKKPLIKVSFEEEFVSFVARLVDNLDLWAKGGSTDEAVSNLINQRHSTSGDITTVDDYQIVKC